VRSGRFPPLDSAMCHGVLFVFFSQLICGESIDCRAIAQKLGKVTGDMRVEKCQKGRNQGKRDKSELGRFSLNGCRKMLYTFPRL